MTNPAPLPSFGSLFDDPITGGSGGAAFLPHMGLLFGGATLSITAAVGSYALNGQAANLKYGRKLACANASFALTGQDATLGEPVAAGGVGAPAPFPWLSMLLERPETDPLMSAAVGTFSVSGQAAALHRGVSLVCAYGSYTVTGAPSLSDFQLTCAVGSYALTGQAASLRKSYTSIVGAVGTFALTGQAAELRVEQPGAFQMAGDVGTFALTGQAAGLTWSTRRIVCEAGSFTVTGQAATLHSTAGIWEIVSPSTGVWSNVSQASTTWN